ncbi:MAG: glycosyltransferase family 4 protein [Candidatus Omnitrophota bacterium]|jgi:glycosyltransferase involved in cell wall biosynthesis
MPKINLLYVITKLELGGAQKQLLSLISSLDKEKYEVFLFTAKNGLLICEAESIRGLTLKRSRFLERPINIFKDILAFVEIYNFIRKNRIQIVHTHSSKAGILGRFAAKAAKAALIIHTVHGWSFHDYQPRVINYLYLFLERFCANFTDKIIVVSNFDKDKGLMSSVGRPKQYVIIRYGINSNEFKVQDRRIAARRLLGLNETALVVGTVACFKPQKSPLDFIKIADGIKRRIPNTEFIMVGDGLLRKKSCALIKKLELDSQIILTGWRNDIPLILSALDIFVLVSSWEGLPIAVLEAMSAGVAVVATDTGGIREVIEDGKTGYLAGVGDRHCLQNRIEELLKDDRKRDEFVRLSEERMGFGEFLLSKMVKKTEEIYSGLGGGS